MTMLYKYCNAKVGLENILTHSSLKWTNPQEFNDPFDCQCQLNFERYEEGGDLILEIETETNSILCRLPITETMAQRFNEGLKNHTETESFKKAQRLFLKTLNLNFGILCLTENEKNILMWSHYADNHRGISLGFSSEGLKDSIFELAKPVLYTSEYPKMLIDDLLKAYHDESLLFAEKLLGVYTSTKFKDWAYEQEWRITLPMDIGEERIKKFDPQELRQVILGAKIESSHAQAIKKLVKEKYPHVEIFQAKIIQGSFTLEISELNELVAK